MQNKDVIRLTATDAVRELVADLIWPVISFDEEAGSPEKPVITRTNQDELALEIYRLAGGEAAALTQNSGEPPEDGFEVQGVFHSRSGFGVILKELLAAADAGVVAQAYGLVMDVRARAVDGLIRVETGMQNFRCIQCGRCCRFLDGAFIACATAEDLERWRRQGREDILAYTAKGYLWVDPQTGEDVVSCPWRRKLPGKDVYECLIQDTKPYHCRRYPLTRKNALRCGCRGFEMQEKL